MDINYAWAAGLLEGEGFFSLKNGTSPQITCEMTDEDIIRRLESMFGGLVTYLPQRQENWKPSWRWIVRGDTASEIMIAILPLMGSRRAEKIANCLGVYAAVNKAKQEKSSLKEEAARRWLNGEASLRKIASEYDFGHDTIRNTARLLEQTLDTA